MKRLTRKRNGMFLGVCLGVAEYLEVDVTVVRLVWTVAAFCGGVGLLAYFAAGFIMPVD